MLLTIHLAVAFVSLIYLAYLLFRPSRFYIAYILVGVTIGTGFALVFIKRPEHLAGICLEGLAYLTVMSTGIIWAKMRQRRKVLSKVPEISIRKI